MTLIEYIESTGTQFIRTGIYTDTSNLKVKAKIMITGISSAATAGGDGLWGSAWTTSGYLFIRYSASPGVLRWHSGGAVASDFPISLNTIYDVETTNTYCKVDDIIHNLPAHYGTDTHALLSIFSVTNLGTGSNAKMRWYGGQIYSGDTLLADYVPVLDDNNVACFYDNVSNTYLYNAGTGDFIAGDPIVPPVPTYTIAFNANSGSGTMPNQTAEVDAYVTLNTCTFVREGYTFIGWSTTSTGSVSYTDGDTVYNLATEGETATLYAVWRKNPPYIIIQENQSETISLTKELVDILQTPFTLKEETSIIDPVFIINCPIDLLFRANYITAPSLGRKYFIQDIVSMTNDLVELTCHVDVLSTYASEIRANKGIIFRQQNDWNLYLNDGVIQAYQNPIVTTQKFPKGFTQQNYVLVCAGSRNIGGVVIGDGGSIDTTFPEEAGGGNLTSKTTSGLVNYCKAQVGNPYWYGTFGQIADATLLQSRRNDYESYYPDPGSPAFVDQYGQRVHDCVGLIKGYRWSDTPTSAPQYVAAQDVDVRGLWSQCNKLHGNVDFSYTSTTHLIGMCVFDSSLTHVGVYIGNGRIIEAQGHAYGVVNNDAYARRAKFTLWGVPDWLKITTSEG